MDGKKEGGKKEVEKKKGTKEGRKSRENGKGKDVTKEDEGRK